LFPSPSGRFIGAEQEGNGLRSSCKGAGQQWRNEGIDFLFVATTMRAHLHTDTRRMSPFRDAQKETSMNVAGFVATTDEELIVRAMRDAQLLLAEHIERGPTDAEEAITQLLEILDRQDVVAATNRLCQEYGLRPLK